MIVLDASVAIKWFLVEPETPEAVRVARAILQGKDLFAVPELFYYEVFSVVARKHHASSQWAGSGMAWLLNLPLRRMPVTPDLAVQMQTFMARGLTGYDAAYAALAWRSQGRWLTYDETAKRRLSSPDWIVSHLDPPGLHPEK